ncbi:Ubiquitin carboxyl-terminal hydrolase 25 [Rhynchospora pubera]|uniref:ubiquitinyl hydrolase 1 n=1 Tax=Rhynchospora pubera TaxID=906938 RepID=A0AAV8HF02_9POAL|nr:Ubiquitin carboxyl-terminal hydrolase 25 [Rhynchospora pubera]
MRLPMAWGPQHRRSGPPRGLKNLSNTCYLNSVLQCLAHTPPLVQFCLASQHSSLCKDFVSQDKECGFCILERQIARLHTPAPNGIFAAAESPSKLLKSLSIFAEHFKWGRQEDAHEFLRYVIDTCHTACIRLLKARSSGGYNGNGGAPNNSGTVMREIFGGALLSQVKCMSCKGESNKTDEIMDLSLDLCQSNSLKDALTRFFQPEILEGSNKYSCERCKKLSVAKKQMFVSQAPNVLVIQLKRFEGINGAKINRKIEFEEVLLLSSFMFNGNQGSQTEYSLFGSIVHAGFSPDSGHYYAYIKDASGNWYCCNDAQVCRSSTQEVLSERVYILFYILKNTNPKPNKIAKNGFTSAPAKTLHSNGGEAPKPSTVIKQNGNCTAKINGNGVPNPQSVKQIGPVKFEIKKSTVGSTTPEVRNKNNTVIKNSNSPSNSCSSGESKSVNKVKSSLSNGRYGGNKSSVLREVQNNIQKDSSPSNGNAEGIQSSLSVHERENNSPRNGVSEVFVSLTKEPKNSVKRESLDENGTSCILQSHQELQKLKDLLVREASSELRTCGWTDEVQSYMRDRKRLCVQQGSSNDLGATLSREQLINESKRAFNSRIPDSLKRKLFQRLTSFSKEYPLLDS